MLNKAISYALEKHSGQFRKGNTIPYIVHPLGVMRILMAEDVAEEVIVAGICHDLLEDTDVSPDEIKSLFGPEVLRLVMNATERLDLDRGASTWKQRKLSKIEHMKSIDDASKLVICADKLDNARSISEDIALGIDPFAKFNAPKEDVKWYYESSLEAMESIADKQSYKLLKQEVESVFGIQGDLEK